MKKSMLLKSLVIGFAIVLIPSTAVMQWIAHEHPVYRKSLGWLRQSPQAAKLLGEGIRGGWWITLKSSRHTLTATMEYAVSGSKGQGDALVSAKKIDGNWELNSVWFRPQGGRIVALLDRRQQRR